MLIPGIVLGVSYRLRNRYHVTGHGIVVIYYCPVKLLLRK